MKVAWLIFAQAPAFVGLLFLLLAGVACVFGPPYGLYDGTLPVDRKVVYGLAALIVFGGAWLAFSSFYVMYAIACTTP